MPFESEIEREIWQPDWKCFCCHDSGIVMPKLVELVIPDYDDKRDKPVACYRCEAGSQLQENEAYDQRFNRGICCQLDSIERDDWTRTVIAQQQQFLEKQQILAQKMSMLRRRDRTPLEELIAQRKHESASNADPQKLIAEAQAYLGSDWLKDGAS